ncbi:MAG: shikimate kinase [Bacteroidales bacterium]|jgi:shikimate kinase|nr:shikimate kinase [Bacteroidales bacterium]
MNIFLTGFMGSGKTTIGRRMAEIIGFDFVDTDSLIEKEEGNNISRIFSERGEEAFRNIEHRLLKSLLQRDYTVISTGGGMPCHHHHMDMMLANGKVVYLHTLPQTLAKRLMRSHTERPLIKGKTPEELQEYIAAKLAEREPFYLRANVVVQTEEFSMDLLLRSLKLMK